MHEAAGETQTGASAGPSRFERKLYVIRKRIEHEADRLPLTERQPIGLVLDPLSDVILLLLEPGRSRAGGSGRPSLPPSRR